MSHDDPNRDERIRERSQARRARQKEETRRAILDAAGKLFAENGYEAFSLRQVAERIGYSPTTIYLYFDDKDQLLFEVALEGFEEFGRMLQDAYASETAPMARMGAIGRAYIRFGIGHPVHYRLMFLHRPEFLVRPRPGGRGPTIDSFGVLFDTVQELLESGSIAHHDPVTVAHLLWSGVHGIVTMAISAPQFDEDQAWRVAELYFPSIVRGLQD